jgi:hypothetical protein
VSFPLAGFLEPVLLVCHWQNPWLALAPFRMRLLKMPFSPEPIFGDGGQVVKQGFLEVVAAISHRQMLAGAT